MYNKEPHLTSVREINSYDTWHDMVSISFQCVVF